MDTKRIRCICGNIYDTANQPVCPECQAAPPFATDSTKISISDPPLPIKGEPTLLDGDQTKRLFLYLEAAKRNRATIGFIVAGVGIVALGSWFIFGSDSKTDSPEKSARKASETPAAVVAPDGLAAAIAAAKPGAIIKLPAGNYLGSFDIDRSIHLLGDDSAGPVIIQNASGRAGLRIKAGASLILENLQITTAQKGEFAALAALDKSSLELRNCNVVGPTTIGVLILRGSKLLATKTTISTRGEGSACQLESASTSNLVDCLIFQNKWGYSATGASEGHATQCRFEKNGFHLGGSSVSTGGAKTYLVIEQSSFTQNDAGVLASEGSGIMVKSCTFKDNGISGGGENLTKGLIGASNGSRLIVEDCTFESNRQGVALLSGATATISGSNFTSTGLHTDDETLQFYSHPISAAGTGTKANVSQTIIKSSVLHAFNIAEGASLEMEDCQVSDGLAAGLGVGVEGKPRCEVSAIRCQFTNNAVSGIIIRAASFVRLVDSFVTGNGKNGISLEGDKTALLAENCDISYNQSCGVISSEEGFGTVISSRLTGNHNGALAGASNVAVGGLLVLNKCKITESNGFGAGALEDSKLVLNDVTVTGNKQNIYQAKDAVVLQNWSGEKDAIDQGNNDVGPPVQTGGKTGMEPSK